MRDAHSGLAMLVAIVLCHLDQETLDNIFDTEAKRRYFNILEISSGLYATLYDLQPWFLNGLMCGIWRLSCTPWSRVPKSEGWKNPMELLDRLLNVWSRRNTVLDLDDLALLWNLRRICDWES